MTHAHGTFCFAELVSPNADSALQFYGDLFGWTAEEVPGPDGSYWLFQIDGRLVAGLRSIRRGRQRWIPYVAVADVNATIAHAERLGARSLDEPFEVSGAARMAAIERKWGRVPERWHVLFAVTDLDRTIDQTEGLGGCEDLPVIDIPNVGRCASLLDDRRGPFFVMQPKEVPR